MQGLSFTLVDAAQNKNEWLLCEIEECFRSMRSVLENQKNRMMFTFVNKLVFQTK